MYDVLQDVIVDHIRENTPVGFVLRYFVITDFNVQDLQGNVSVLRVGESAAAFDLTDPSETNMEVPDQETVELWMKEAIDTQLVAAMNDMFSENYDQTAFVELQQARYMSATDTDVDGVQDGSISASRSRSGGDGASTALSVSVAIAGVAILLLTALLVKSHRHRSKEAVTPISLETTAAHSFDSGGHSSNSRPLRPILHLPTVPEEASSQGRSGSVVDSTDLRSLPESESSWTIATDVGDSTALQSGMTHASAAIVSAESFEHDRQIYIQKDMLTTSWSGQNTSMGRKTSHLDSVLQPSYFRASASPGERKGRRQWTDNDESPSPFVVASHDDAELGEEVFLMPDEAASGGGLHGELA
jgi:hypothetical protein